MSSSKEDEPIIDIDIQIIYDQHIVCRFDYPKNLNTPYVRDLVYWFIGFGIVNIVGLDSTKVQINDIVLKIAHIGLITKTQF
jgi:hypothetical protein